MKKIISLAIVLVMVVSLASCMVTEKVFTTNGLQITLNSSFREKADIAADNGYTVCFDSAHVAVFGLREAKADCKAVGIDTLAEYANAIYDANSSRNPNKPEKDGSVYVMEYEFHNSEENETYKYYTVLCEAEDAFWMVQFASLIGKYDDLKPEMEKWAKTIEFVD